MMTSTQLAAMAAFVDAVEKAAIEAGVSFVPGYSVPIRITDGKGGDQPLRLLTRGQDDTWTLAVETQRS